MPEVRIRVEREDQMTVKPPYAVPSMAAIRSLPWNGFTAVSTFSGCGGSSLGYRMAGFRVAWASEFIPAAQECYRANQALGTVLDTRDIRDVTGEELLRDAGRAVGDIDLFDGSPPCASFSTAGKREQGWGAVKKYSDAAQRTDDLFYEYARLIGETQPRTFVAENVSGLVKGTAKGYFKLILARLKDCGYRVEARLLDASWLGVPQARQRLIFVGVRDDLGLPPAFPRPLPYRYTVRDALPWIIAQGDNGGYGGYGGGSMRGADPPSPTIGASPQTGNGRFPPSKVIATGTPVTTDPETGENISMARYAVGREWHNLGPGEKSEKYLSLVKPHPDRPYPTITARGGDISAASAAHWSEPRKLTLAELRRVCGFPDDFTLTGSYEQRWERIGRAVPPVMMSHIAAAVRDHVLIPAREREGGA